MYTCQNATLLEITCHGSNGDAQRTDLFLFLACPWQTFIFSINLVVI